MRRLQRSDLLGASVVLLLVVLAFFEIFFLGKTLSTSAQLPGVQGFAPPVAHPTPIPRDNYRHDGGASAWGFEPWAKVTSRTWKEGQVPLWNPHQGFGAPHLANVQSGVLDPLLLPPNLSSTQAMWDVSLLGAFLLGALGTYIFLRLLGLSPLACVVASAAFVLSGPFLLYSNHPIYRGFFLLPALLAGVEWTARKRGPYPAVATGILATLSIYAGMPEVWFFVLLASGAYGLYRLWYGPRSGSRVRILWRLSAAATLAMALSAPLVIPFVLYLPLAFHLHAPDIGQGMLTDPSSYLLNWLIPLIRGEPGAPFAGGTFSGTRGWSGAAIAVLSIAALSARDAMRRWHGWFFLGAGLFVTAKVYGMPGVQWIGALPIFNTVKFPFYGLFLAAFCLAVLAGIGIEAILGREISSKRLMVFGGLLALGVGVLFVRSADAISGGPPGFLARQLALACIAAVVCLGMIILGQRIPRRSRIAAALAAAVVIGELMLLVPRGIYAPRFDPYLPPPWMAHLEGRPGRVFGLDSLLYPNTAAAFSLQDLRSVDALQVDRYVTYIRTFIEPEFHNRFIGAPYGSDRERTRAHIEDNPMFDVTGVRWIVARSPIAGTQYRKVGEADGVTVWENVAAAPRAFLLYDLEAVEDVDEALELMRARELRLKDGAIRVTSFDPQRRAIVEVGPDPPPVIGPEDPNGGASIESYSATRIAITVDTSTPALLVLTDAYFPGWRAEVDGEKAAILPTHIAFRGIPVTAGASQVVLEYQPFSFRLGVLLALAGLLLSMVWCITPTVRRRIGPPERVDRL